MSERAAPSEHDRLLSSLTSLPTSSSSTSSTSASTSASTLSPHASLSSSSSSAPAIDKSKFYKVPNYMSASAFQTMTDALSQQKELTMRKVRSLSVGNDMNKMGSGGGSDAENDGNGNRMEIDGRVRDQDIETTGRRALYGTLPFFSTFGMSSREMGLRDVISKASSDALSAISTVSKARKRANSQEQPDFTIDEIIMTVPLLMAILVATLSQFLVGYNTSVMNAPAAFVFPGHTTAQWSVSVAAFAVGGPAGALLGGMFANRLGRRKTILLNSWIFMLGGILMTAAPNVYFLMPSRLIIGFASGLSSVVVPVYLGEMAPPTMRGTLGTLTQFAMVIGIFASGMLALLWASSNGWRNLFAVTPVVCVLQFVVSPLLMESPRWLLNVDPNSLEARKVIKNMRGFRSDSEVEREVQHYLFASAQHKTNRTSAHSTEAMWDLLNNLDLRVLVVSCIVLQMAQQLCGINAVFYYSTSFFTGVLDNPLLGTNLVAFVNVVATYVALKLMDRTARRTLLLVSAGGMLVSTFFIIVAVNGYLPNTVALAAVMAFVSFFEIGLGPIPWLIVAEMFDSKYVATAMSISCILNWFCNFLVGLLFPFMRDALGTWSFIPFGIVLMASLSFTWLYLPETYGRSVDEIQRLAQDPFYEELKQTHTIEAVDSYSLYDTDAV